MPGHPLSYLHLKDLIFRSSSQLAVRTTDQTKPTGNIWHTYAFKSISFTDCHKRLKSHWKEAKYTVFNLTHAKLPAPILTVRIFHVIQTKEELQD